MLLPRAQGGEQANAIIYLAPIRLILRNQGVEVGPRYRLGSAFEAGISSNGI